MKINTVNVIEISDTATMSVNRLFAFPDTAEGNKEAEETFRKIVATKGEVDEEDGDMVFILDEGYWEKGCYWIGIVHSMAPNDNG